MAPGSNASGAVGKRARALLLAAVVAAPLCAPAAAFAEPATDTGARLAIDIEADGDGAWRARAVAATLGRDLAGGGRVELVQVPGPGCSVGDGACVAARYGDGADLVLLGTLSPDRLRYELRSPARPRSPIAAGAVELGEADRRSLAHEVGRGLDAALRPGGVLDRQAGQKNVPADLGWVIYLAGGLAWGWFVAVLWPLIFPVFPGLERIDPANLFRMLWVWGVVAAQRAARVALFYAPVMAAVWLGCGMLGVPPSIALAVVVPVAGLVTRLGFAAMVAALSRYLDRHLIDGEPDRVEAWDRAVRGYFMGYVRRGGWPADERILDDVRFLPGRGEGVAVYGGGLTHTRIVIGTSLLEYALAPYDRPHDYSAPREHKLLWTEWNVGLVVPIETTDPVASPDERRSRHAPLPGETQHEPLGEPPTLAGIVEPESLDARPARRPREDPLWLDWDPGEEHDGTDASDRDFLFGALVGAHGVARRKDDQLLTFAEAARVWARKRASLGRLAAWGARPHRLLLSRYPAELADAYAAVNFARHQLVQYLAWRHWRRDDLLTARAYVPELERTSAEILRQLEKEPEAGPAGATPRRRLLWLSRFFRTPVQSRRSRTVRRTALAVAAGAAIVLVGIGVKRAVDYHPVYLQRLDRAQLGEDDSRHPAPPSDQGRPENGEEE